MPNSKETQKNQTKTINDNIFKDYLLTIQEVSNKSIFNTDFILHKKNY